MKVNCFRCKYFKVTWDPGHPRGCTAYNFKTGQIPSIVVKQSSGMECLKFEPKKSKGERR
ncbi:uracil-DNA glycosylase [Ureibacillus sp. FSL K6-8385]|uniref:Uracil-DNA glycosylase n=1 Tax=Ureibacillus terrenus TaxID=118246 RepID=A0A540V297_9BACL|nr:uracil-DNA glycosylase [Ureibacillus terrenus]MED3661320.1 uracil-DNA glycosylase [Ureibacillus terrenus]MED3764208.1 uracil-DNA glycosylase [Ureibacillus terrenus]TQE90841.1 uracil-DNA glycosylase [Ureibacillus terrenus]